LQYLQYGENIMNEVGVDIVDIARFAKAMERESFLQKFFHPEEIAYARASAKPEQHLAARFAAREAVRKVLLSKVSSLDWKDSWILNDQNGKPVLHFSRDLLKRVRIRHSSVSLSHSGDYAVAVVLIEVR
jgi:holo-[acyl-carrier protein] synthase